MFNIEKYFVKKKEIHPEDVVFCYKKILGREPENQNVIQGHLAASSDFRSLVTRFLNSDEFAQRLARNNCARFPIHPLSNEQRVAMTIICRDTDPIPKVANAGQVIEQGGDLVQIMHNGLKVKAGGYCDQWTVDIIRGLSGHHEPQEELLFHHLLRHCRPNTLMVEGGAWWAYYSMWYLQAITGSEALCIEPDLNNIACGKYNMELNALSATWENACLGAEKDALVSLIRDSDHESVQVRSVNMKGIVELVRSRPIEMLHLDIQGAELPLLSSIQGTSETRLLRFVVLSTHHESISNSKTTHQDCLNKLQELGAIILAEHPIEESFSGDGLIVASFLTQDRNIQLPTISRNIAEGSLFGPSN